MLALAILQENVVILSLSTEVTLSHLISLKLQDFGFYIMGGVFCIVYQTPFLCIFVNCTTVNNVAMTCFTVLSLFGVHFSPE